MSNSLGDSQKNVLMMMNSRNRVWYHGCGWLWGTPGETERIMQTLERRGLVTSGPDSTRMVYTLTGDGVMTAVRLQVGTRRSTGG